MAGLPPQEDVRVDDPMILTEFFTRHGGNTQEEFLATFNGAFLLGRQAKTAPYVLHVPKDASKTVWIGSDEDCEFDLNDPTLDSRHASLTYHKGFRGWNLEATETSFGTFVDGDRVKPGRNILLRDRSVIKVGGMTQLQFYMSETLYGRMSKAGITRSLRRGEVRDAAAEHAKKMEATAADDSAPAEASSAPAEGDSAPAEGSSAPAEDDSASADS